MWIEWTIATRFLREGRVQSTLILVGIAVGVAVIVFLTALITGLQANIINRTLGTQAHIKVQPPEEYNRILPPAPGTTQLLLESKRAQRLRSINNWQQVRDVLDTMPGIAAVSPLISGPAFARRGAALQSVALVGIDAQRYLRIIPVQEDIVAGVFRIGAGDTVIGKQLATDLGMRVGDKLRLDGGQGRESVVNVAGIFELGVRELDARYVYLDMKQAQSLLNLPGAATMIDVTVDEIFDAQSIAQRIARLTGLKAESWMETNSQLMNALRSQSLSTQMISAFVALSVALGIASVLSVSVVQRTREIGILRAMGTTRQQMLGVFLVQGALFGLAGSLLGALAGYGLVSAFNIFGPKLFYIPVDPWLPVAATALATVTGILSAAVPARRAAALDPVEAIRHV
ncbi:ABC transporter permease [Pseudoduganella umbonata]|uniref:ABC transporter permease n=1 Tax=Pseudoduganella umbonata TaxID=864828 RepID=A0A4P8HV27_9BURK|nr:FtsX-like permease family protein [Pseudoduganella umbonata]MBB3223101.1 lipoprotein-releasing system permease protein [Pseudoduganella umbonata]QCP13196.1 ABC transporter permease [Pseudoduganella umbonata]